jgi:hypothetical protein
VVILRSLVQFQLVGVFLSLSFMCFIVKRIPFCIAIQRYDILFSPAVSVLIYWLDVVNSIAVETYNSKKKNNIFKER